MLSRTIHPKTVGLLLVLVFLSGLLVWLALYAYQFVSWGNDWDLAFLPALRAWLVGRNPYVVEPGYASPPWGLLVLTPLVWVSPALAMFLPALALLYLSVSRHKWSLIPLVALNPVFIIVSIYANVDWIVMLGVALGGPLGVILDTLKPQAGVMAIMAELAKRKTHQARLRLISPLVLLAGLTLPLWSTWLLSIGDVGSAQARSLTSLYPRWLGLVGFVVAIVMTIRKQSPLWGCVASLALAPYWQIHSLLPLMFLIADRDWRWGIVANLATWGFVLLVILGRIPLVL